MLRTAVVLAVLLPAPLAGQMDSVAPGQRIRIERRAPSSTIVGNFSSGGGDSVAVFSGVALHRLPLASIARVSVSRGKTRVGGFKRGVRVGALVGGGAALLLAGGAFLTDPTIDGLPVLGGFVLGGAVVGAVYGAPIGALIPTESWRTVYVRPTQP